MDHPYSVYCGAVCDGPKGWRWVRYQIVRLFKLNIT
jgi:hypothetical protein